MTGMPSAQEGKLLSVPKLQYAKGCTQAMATYDTLVEWHANANVVAMVFDTAASNSGWINGACKNLEELLDRRLLWCACRHHIFKWILYAVFRELFGKSTSPDNELAREFRETIWHRINTNEDHMTLRITNRHLKWLK